MYLPYPNPIAACGAPPALAALPSLSAGYPRGFHHTGAGSVVGQCFPSFAQAPGVPIMGATQNQFFPTTMRGVFPPAMVGFDSTTSCITVPASLQSLTSASQAMSSGILTPLHSDTHAPYPGCTMQQYSAHWMCPAPTIEQAIVDGHPRPHSDNGSSESDADKVAIAGTPSPTKKTSSVPRVRGKASSAPRRSRFQPIPDGVHTHVRHASEPAVPMSVQPWSAQETQEEPRDYAQEGTNVCLEKLPVRPMPTAQLAFKATRREVKRKAGAVKSKAAPDIYDK
jgi:hypothetical protein